MDPSKSLQIMADVTERMRSQGIPGKVESVAYPVNTSEVGLKLAKEVPDAAVVTFSSSYCASSYAALKAEYRMLSESSQQFVAPAHHQLAAQFVKRFGTHFPRFAHCMKEAHGITINLMSTPTLIVGWAFQVNFLMKIIQSVTQPLTQDKLAKYPFVLNIPPPNVRVSRLETELPLSPQFNHYLTQCRILEKLQRKHGVAISVERRGTGAFLCRATGSNSQGALQELQKLQEEKEATCIYLEISQHFSRFQELQRYIQMEGNPKGVDLAVYRESRQILSIMGDQGEIFVAQLLTRFPDLLPKPTEAPNKERPALVVIMDLDLLKYIREILAKELAEILRKYDIDVDCNILDSHGEFVLKGVNAAQAEKEIGKIAEKFQENLCIQDVYANTYVSDAEMDSLKKEFNHVAVIEYDRKRSRFHIIAGKAFAHSIKDEVTKKFGSKHLSGSGSGSVGSGGMGGGREAGAGKPGKSSGATGAGSKHTQHSHTPHHRHPLHPTPTDAPSDPFSRPLNTTSYSDPYVQRHHKSHPPPS